METHGKGDVTMSSDADLMTTHVIPSVELRGSRAQKVRKLDTLIAYLEQLRRSLSGELPRAYAGTERPSPYIDRPVWPWMAAGVVIGALLVSMLLAMSVRAL